MLTVLLAVVLAAIAVRLAIRLLGLGLPGWNRAYAISQIDKAADFTIFGLGIAFVVWFRRARINAGRFGWRQRRAKGWTFWGWIIPVVSLWIPFQLMGDVWRAGLPASRRQRVAWLPALWWTSWLVSFVMSDTRASTSWVMPHLTDDSSTAGLVVLATSAAALIAIVRAISAGPVGIPPVTDFLVADHDRTDRQAIAG